MDLDDEDLSDEMQPRASLRPIPAPFYHANFKLAIPEVSLLINNSSQQNNSTPKFENNSPKQLENENPEDFKSYNAWKCKNIASGNRNEKSVSSVIQHPKFRYLVDSSSYVPKQNAEEHKSNSARTSDSCYGGCGTESNYANQNYAPIASLLPAGYQIPHQSISSSSYQNPRISFSQESPGRNKQLLPSNFLNNHLNIDQRLSSNSPNHSNPQQYHHEYQQPCVSNRGSNLEKVNYEMTAANNRVSQPDNVRTINHIQTFQEVRNNCPMTNSEVYSSEWTRANEYEQMMVLRSLGNGDHQAHHNIYQDNQETRYPSQSNQVRNVMSQSNHNACNDTGFNLSDTAPRQHQVKQRNWSDEVILRSNKKSTANAVTDLCRIVQLQNEQLIVLQSQVAQLLSRQLKLDHLNTEEFEERLTRKPIMSVENNTVLPDVQPGSSNRPVLFSSLGSNEQAVPISLNDGQEIQSNLCTDQMMQQNSSVGPVSEPNSNHGQTLQTNSNHRQLMQANNGLKLHANVNGGQTMQVIDCTGQIQSNSNHGQILQSNSNHGQLMQANNGLKLHANVNCGQMQSNLNSRQTMQVNVSRQIMCTNVNKGQINVTGPNEANHFRLNTQQFPCPINEMQANTSELHEMRNIASNLNPSNPNESQTWDKSMNFSFAEETQINKPSTLVPIFQKVSVGVMTSFVDQMFYNNTGQSQEVSDIQGTKRQFLNHPNELLRLATRPKENLGKEFHEVGACTKEFKTIRSNESEAIRFGLQSTGFPCTDQMNTGSCEYNDANSKLIDLHTQAKSTKSSVNVSSNSDEYQNNKIRVSSQERQCIVRWPQNDVSREDQILKTKTRSKGQEKGNARKYRPQIDKLTPMSAYVDESISFNNIDLGTAPLGEHNPTPEPSMHIYMQDYKSSDDEQELDSTNPYGQTCTNPDSLSSTRCYGPTLTNSFGQGEERVGWTFYNNVVGQVNEILKSNPSRHLEDSDQFRTNVERNAEPIDRRSQDLRLGHTNEINRDSYYNGGKQDGNQLRLRDEQNSQTLANHCKSYEPVSRQNNGLMRQQYRNPQEQWPMHKYDNVQKNGVQNATMEYLRRLGVSVYDPDGNAEKSFQPDCCNSGAQFETSDMSFRVNGLAMKHLQGDQFSEYARINSTTGNNMQDIMVYNIATKKTNMSIATMQFQHFSQKQGQGIGSDRYIPIEESMINQHLGHGNQNLEHYVNPQNKILDITTLKQQPKLM